MRGRKPTPTPLKLATGNPGRRPINLHSFAPLAEIPECPPHLKGEARAEWDRLTEQLDKYNMIGKVDRGAIAMACTAWARYVYAEEMIEKASQKGGSGLFVQTSNGFPVQSPWLLASNKAMEQYRGWCAEFGMTPAARVRVAPQTSQLDLELVGGTDVEKRAMGDYLRNQ